jgi:hypothetical protein
MYGKNEKDLHDSGTTIKSNIISSILYGFLSQEYYAYENEHLNNKPPKHIFDLAKKNRDDKINSYKLIPQTNYMLKYALVHYKVPILFGTVIHESFFNLDDTFTVPTPKKGDTDDKFIGMHALCITGFTEDKFEIWTSWRFGKDKTGVFYMKNDYLLDHELCFDFMSLSK